MCNRFASEEELIKSDEVEEADAIVPITDLQIDFLNRCKKIRWIHPHVEGLRGCLAVSQKRHNSDQCRGTAGVPYQSISRP